MTLLSLSPLVLLFFSATNFSLHLRQVRPLFPLSSLLSYPFRPPPLFTYGSPRLDPTAMHTTLSTSAGRLRKRGHLAGSALPVSLHRHSCFARSPCPYLQVRDHVLLLDDDDEDEDTIFDFESGDAGLYATPGYTIARKQSRQRRRVSRAAHQSTTHLHTERESTHKHTHTHTHESTPRHCRHQRGQLCPQDPAKPRAAMSCCQALLCLCLLKPQTQRHRQSPASI